MGRTVGMLQTQSVGGADDPVPNVPAQHNKEMSLHVGVTWGKNTAFNNSVVKRKQLCVDICVSKV